MDSNRIKCALLFLMAFFVWPVFLKAQESVNTTGSNATGSGGTVSYSVGQVVYHTHTGANVSVAEGVQQPYEISVVTAIYIAEGINLSVIAYPNPTTDYLQLKVEAGQTFNMQALNYQLYDMAGKLLQSKKMIKIHTEIYMGGYVPATYFLKVSSDNTVIKSFKIVKH